MQVTKFNKEDYNQVKQAHLNRGLLFEDENFPCDVSKIQCLIGDSYSSAEFKRPNQICDDPVLRRIGPPNAICRGKLSNVNVALALSVISERSELLDGLCPDWNSQNVFGVSNTYAGVFQFRFWIDGAFTLIIIDDRLPVLNDRFMCPHSSDPNEIWPSLLVKAYAKLIGGWERLESVRLEDVLQDLTGCVLDTLPFAELSIASDLRRVNAFETLQDTLLENSLVLLCTKSHFQSDDQEKNILSNGMPLLPNDGDVFDELCAPRLLGDVDKTSGLCANYAYMLTKTCLLPRDTSVTSAILSVFKTLSETGAPPKERLLRLRSVLTVSSKATSFGEWKGAYSDTSKEWEELTLNQRTRIGLVLSTESEFWMPLAALVQYFCGAIVCRLPKTGIFNRWTLADFRGTWSGDRSGGSLNFRNTFLDNPQFMFEMTKDSPEEVLISLTRMYSWDADTNVILDDLEPPGIGFALIKVEINRQVRAHVLSQCKMIDVHGPKRHRATFGRYHLERGRYVLVPFLEEPNQEANFYLRFYLPRALEHKELIFDQPPRGLFAIFHSSPILITRVEVRRGSNLARLNSRGLPSPYCRVSCEGVSVVTGVKSDNTNPGWNDSFLFYRSKPAKQPIRFEVFDKRTISSDGFMGEALLSSPESTSLGDHDLELYSRPSGNETKVRLKGSISVSLFSVDAENFSNI